MDKAIVTGQRQVSIVSVPDPEPHENWVVVKVHAAPLCTEYKAYVSGQPTEYLGHKAAGEVVAVAQPCRVQVGDRVVVMPLMPCGQCSLCIAGDYIYCENKYSVRSATVAQYLIKQDWLLLPIPDDLSYEQASLACCALGPSHGAFQRAGLTTFDTVLITGAGPVGIGALVNGRFRGARAIVVESFPWRIERAWEMGAALVLDPRQPDALAQIRVMTSGRGVDIALDCSGTVQAQRLCIDATRRRGTVTFVGECHDDLAIKVSPDMIRKGLTLIGSWHYNLQEYPRILHVIQGSPLIDLLVSHHFPMSQIADAFELQASGQCAKVILDPWA